MILDNDMLSVMLAAGDTMQIELLATVEARSNADYTGNKMGTKRAGEYTAYSESDKCFAINGTKNHWVLKSNCRVIGEAEPPPPPASDKVVKLIAVFEDGHTENFLPE